MSYPTRINRESAEELFMRFAPMFADFESRRAGDAADDERSPYSTGLRSKLSRILGGR